ncbi:hypothetical protein [Bradyrhizobium lablabi]|uniref:hypothetical protein n=1 Tax=Bradyrhizobium lablabi TaxID=722472 RepID=UPI0012AC2143|nr:hypothetical protein [Bradyrhizobium lablabi]
MQFEAFAHYEGHESGKPESAYCFDALAASVDDVSSELLETYVGLFQKTEHRKIGSALRQSIQQGLWSPKNATEYMLLVPLDVAHHSGMISPTVPI